ncbi:MAG: hypothetical protein ACO30N_00895 [Schleiferiaceae bacterium]|jgi:hypothetical protein
MKTILYALAGLLTLGVPQLSAQTPRIELELGYLRTWHADDAVTRREWIQVPGTWRDPSAFPGQSQYAFTFRDTAWAYRFNHNHPMFTTRIRLGAKPDARWQFFLIQSAMWNSWHQLSFMLGGEASYQPNAAWRFGLQAGGLSGYHLVHRLQNSALLSVDGPEGGVFAGANLTVDYRINPHWRVRLAGNHLIAGLGLYYAWSPKPDPAPRT